MKKLKYSIKNSTILSLIILALITTISCSKSDDSETTPEEEEIVPVLPTISLYSGEEDIYLGVVGSPTQGSLQHQIKAIAPDGFVSLEILKVLNGVTTSYALLNNILPDDFAGDNTYIYTLDYTMDDINEAGSDLNFKAVVKDINNNAATIDFAQVDLRLPMLKKTVTLKTTLPPVGDITIPYYLRILETNVAAVNHDVAVGVDYDEFIAFAFSVNDGSGYYLGSLSIVEAIISNGMQQKSTTKFKESVDVSLNKLKLYDKFDIYDVHNIEQTYAALSFNSHEQKAEQISTVGKIVYFKTDDNRAGVLQVKSFIVDGNTATLQLDLFVTN